jgi:hypothetical protein
MTKTQLITLIIIAASAASAIAEPRHRHKQRSEADYIIRRQQVGSVNGPPVQRHYIGGRTIDIYRNGLMFEKDNVVGIKGR